MPDRRRAMPRLLSPALFGGRGSVARARTTDLIRTPRRGRTAPVELGTRGPRRAVPFQYHLRIFGGNVRGATVVRALDGPDGEPLPRERPGGAAAPKPKGPRGYIRDCWFPGVLHRNRPPPTSCTSEATVWWKTQAATRMLYLPSRKTCLEAPGARCPDIR